jgi:single-strand DNA-binding protein
MANLNKVMLMGNVTRDIELRYTPGGTAVASFGLATNRRWKDKKTGDNREEATFIDIEVWAKTAELCHQYLSKGSPVFIEGRLKLDQWESKEGQKRSKLRVVAESVQFLSSGKGGRPAAARAAQKPGPEGPPGDEPPPAEAAGDTFDDVKEDDIPF